VAKKDNNMLINRPAKKWIIFFKMFNADRTLLLLDFSESYNVILSQNPNKKQLNLTVRMVSDLQGLDLIKIRNHQK